MKVLGWNVQWCRGMDGRVDPARVVAQAMALGGAGGPDVLCLQEVADGYPELAGHDGSDQAARLAALLPHWHVVYGPAIEEYAEGGSGGDAGGARRPMRFGNVVATRLDVLRIERHPLPMPADPSVPAMPRQVTVVTVRDPALGPVRILSTHLEYYSDVQRLAQAQALRALHRQDGALARHPPRTDREPAGSPFQARPYTMHAVLCGDFNAEAGGPEWSALTARGDGAWSDAWTLANPGRPRPPTFRLHDPDWRGAPVSCDFAFVSDSLRGSVVRCDVDGDTQVSDHQPVLLELRPGRS